MTVAVVTPWVDHPELIGDYDRAVRPEHPDEIVVVDNGSAPPLDYAAVRLDENAGFCRACNDGLYYATADKVVFLNNDVKLQAGGRGWLRRLAAAIEPGVLAGARLRTDLHARVAEVTDPLHYLDGWCFGGMRDDLVELGGFDEEYAEPAYYSDNDLCLRARARGMRLREVTVGLYHKTSATALEVYGQDAIDIAIAANYQRYSDLARSLLTVAA